jgi:dTDP-4-dehydrorhamnose reductase
MEFEKKLAVQETCIPGLLVFDLPVHGDNRGWFKENWQRAKMTGMGLPDFGPVQNNISFNTSRGTTRGIHAEPWDKFISVGCGEIFGAWVDLRPGETFGRVFTCRIDPSRAVYTPRGVGNSFQTLEDGTVYTYLVNAHWSAERKAEYTFVNLADTTLGIDWPIPLAEATLSEADKHHPMLKDARPMEPLRTLVTGGDGQLGRALQRLVAERGLAGWEFTDAQDLDITDPEALGALDWDAYGAIVNCAAYTAVDKAETPEGRAAAWRVNVQGAANLARVAAGHGVTMVHVSSDYVFDGTREVHAEGEGFAPLGVYGQTKAAADAAVANVPRHYIVRTSWVVGDGKNFVRTMEGLSRRCAQGELPGVTVVDDQFGRLTFASTLAGAIVHLLDSGAPYGTYNVTGEGPSASWCDIAREVFRLTCGNAEAVAPVSTEEYAAGSKGPVSPRPRHSTLDLAKIESAGFTPGDWRESLGEYLKEDGSIKKNN